MNERKTPTAELRQTPTNDKEGGWGDEEAKAKLVAEQARIQQHYKRLVQQRKDYEQSGGDLVDEVYQGQAEIRAERPDRIDRGERSERSERSERGERGERSDHKDSLPASLVAARPGSRSGITGLSSDPRFGNYNDEIQRHLNRRQAQYHSQVFILDLFTLPNTETFTAERAPSQVGQTRVKLLRVRVSPVQHLTRPAGEPEQHRQWRPAPPTRAAPPQVTSQAGDAATSSQDLARPRARSVIVVSLTPCDVLCSGSAGNNPLTVRPSNYGYYATTRTTKNDYEDHRNFQPNHMADYDDPYGRIVFRDGSSIPAGRRPSHPGQGHTVPHSGHRMQHSLSHPRIQSHQGIVHRIQS